MKFIGPAIGMWNSSGAATPVHACNCIGCCRECGMCRTDPQHASVCGRIAKLNAERREILSGNR